MLLNESQELLQENKISKKETDILDEHYLCQPSAVKHNENQQDLYNRTIEKHGIKMKSYVAVQKKLLVHLPYLKKMKNMIQIIY
jgi:hypothetical protein